ncbi:MAG: aspartate aminotransferase family protein [Spirochaetales bacterium]|nr:aspartate aminotransferase family protein [Spirochaetales bacterium]
MKKTTKEDYCWWNPFTQMEAFLQRSPIIIDKAEGIYLYDTNQKRYLDMSSSMWNVCLGHNQRTIIEAINKQYMQLDFSSPFRASNSKALELTKKLTNTCQDKLKKVFLTCNGSDSVEAGIKIARQYSGLKNTKKNKVISLINSYHGVSYGAMAASGFEEDKKYFKPIPEGFIQIPQPYCYRCPYNKTYPACNIECARFLEKEIKKQGEDTIALFLMEPVMGMGGIIIPPAEYYDIIFDTCKKYQILIMFDEVTTGFGRTGKMFAFEHLKHTPDMVALGKALSNGYFPIGATLVKDEIWQEFLGDDEKRFNHGSTYFGHPVGCTAAIETITIIQQEDLVNKVKGEGEYFLKQLLELKNIPIVGDVRGIGMMFGIEFVEDQKNKIPLNKATMLRFISTCYMYGLWAHFAGNCMLIFPPFICKRESLDTALTLIKKAVHNVIRKSG